MKIGVFPKIFAYTILLLLLMCLAAILLFARQFFTFYRIEQQRQLTFSFQPILTAMSERNRSSDEIIEMARVWAAGNQSFKFMIQEGNGNVLFLTPDSENLMNSGPGGINLKIMSLTRSPNETAESSYIFTGYGAGAGGINYGDLIRRSVLALVIMLLIAIAGAVLFAKKVTKPLEDEIIREREMEENQRLFFSAASHELKTPIASARALVEGMMAGVGDYRDHRKYLPECLKTLDSQAALVSEILEIVKLSDKKTHTVPLSEVDLSEAGNPVLAEYRLLAQRQGLEIDGEFPGICVQADRSLLQRVLSNVLANAVQNTGEGGKIIIAADVQKKVRVSILNTNTHIPDDLIARLFEPFHRLDSARTSGSMRSGLGLAIVKKSLERMSVPFSLENSAEGVLFRMDLLLAKNYSKTPDSVQF